MKYYVKLVGDSKDNIMEYMTCKFRFPVEFLYNDTIVSQNAGSFFDCSVSNILNCDFVIINISREEPFHLGAEIMLAKVYKLPVYGVGNLLNCSYEYASFLKELCNHIFDSKDDLADYLNELYLFGRLGVYHGKLDIDDALSRLKAFDAGYDKGYFESERFWGDHPASMVMKAAEFLENNQYVRCLDLGCGTGKNAIFLSKKGFSVLACDSSYYAIMEAKTLSAQVEWSIQDARKINLGEEYYDLIVMTGILHCLSTEAEVYSVIDKAKNATKVGGYHVVSVFNDRDQDLKGHSDDFHPILLSHESYLDKYKGWNIIAESDSDLPDIHPNLGIKHKHSITRILAQKLCE